METDTDRSDHEQWPARGMQEQQRPAGDVVEHANWGVGIAAERRGQAAECEFSIIRNTTTRTGDAEMRSELLSR